MAELSPIALQKALKGADYPASRGDLVKLAHRNSAGQDVVNQLEALPEKEYGGPDAVTHEVFGSS